MNIFGFILVLFVYAYLCYLVVFAYFNLMARIKMSITNKIIRTFYQYALFLVFLVVDIPFSIFFPAWVSEKFLVIEHSSTSTLNLILLGCCVLVLTLWIGKKRSGYIEDMK